MYSQVRDYGLNKSTAFSRAVSYFRIMKREIPIRFRYKGTVCTGILAQVMGGGGSSVYHLYVNRFYWGRLRYADGWCFDPTPKTQGLEVLAEWMGDKVSALPL